MQACVLPVWLYCLSDFCCCCRSCCPLFVWFLFGAWSSLLILFSHSLCLHPLTSYIIFPLSVFASTHVFVRSVFVSTLLACVVCVDPAGLCHFDLSLSFVGVSANSACAHSLCLCELAVFVPTQSFCTLCDFLPTLCLCAHDVSLPTLLLSFCSLGCPFCLCCLCHSYVSVSAAHSLISNSLCFCPLFD